MNWLPLQLDISPTDAFRAWPANQPIAALWSGAPSNPNSRWTLLAKPNGDTLTLDPSRPFAWPEPFTRLYPAPPSIQSPDSPPFCHGWIGFLSYELGGSLEPKAAPLTAHPSPWPLLHWQRFNTALAFDHGMRQWWALGDESTLLAQSLRTPPPPSPTFTLSEPTSRVGQHAFETSVARAIEYIRAGDIYQANIAHSLRSTFSGSSRDFFLSLVAAAEPWFGAYLEFTHANHRCAIASASPELFLSLDPHTRRATTRPMKGTRLITADLDEPAARAELTTSEKDRAELAMIVDLMRNDLGRACAPRSIRVDVPHAIERHASLLQATATVSGTLAPYTPISRLLESTFPGGSITGAPKIRAMQIIRELEPFPRGPYCGCIGLLGDDGSLRLNIAIRTAAIQQPNIASSSTNTHSFSSATLDYGVGAGIVADSTPPAEWRETLAKAQVLRQAHAYSQGRP